VGPLLAVLLLATAVAAFVWWWRSPGDSVFGAEGLLAGFAAAAALVLAIGWGRSGFPIGAGRAPRYVTLAAPLLWWCYLAWCRLPWPALGRAIQVAFCASSVLLYPGNFAHGIEDGRARRERTEDLRKDLEAGLTIPEIAVRRAGQVYPTAQTLQERLFMLRHARVGPFAPEAASAAFRRLFPFVDAPIIRVRQGLYAIQPASVDGRTVLTVHAEGDLVLDVRPGLHEASLQFGVVPAAYTSPARPADPAFDGTYFTVTFESDAGTSTVLYARLLNPRENTAEQRAQSLTMALSGEGGELTLGTRFGPPGSGANGWGDWGYWSDIRLR
jgi:hypothetical protein